MYQKKYIENFTEYQITQFDTNFKKVMKNKLMSFYSYLNYHFLAGENIKMSIDELTSRWNNKHNKKGKKEKCICRATMYNWIKKLETAKLIKIDEESADTFIYTLICEEIFSNKELDKELDKNLDKENRSQSIENTEFVDSKSCDNISSLVDIKDIDTKGIATIPIKTNFKKYIEKCTWEYASETMLEVFNILKIRSNFVKALVIEKIEKYYWNISKCGVKFYIAKIIKQVQLQCQKNAKIKCFSSEKISEQWGYKGQRDYTDAEMNKIEKGLLGWNN